MAGGRHGPSLPLRIAYLVELSRNWSSAHATGGAPIRHALDSNHGDQATMADRAGGL
jgi:hypothetical protein